MRKITKLMLTLALLVAGVGVANAGKLYADLSKLGNGPESTWDGATNTMTWKGKSNNMITNFDFSAGNYRAYSTISITVSNLSNASGVRLQIRANGKDKLVTLNGIGSFTKNLKDDFGFTTADLANVEWVRLLGSSWDDGHTIDADNLASAVISDVYLSLPTNVLDVDLNSMKASDGNATWDKSTDIFAWSGTWSNAIELPGLSGNLSAYSTVNYETEAGTCDHFRILVYYSNGTAQTTYQATVGNKSVTFEEMGVAAANLASIASIKISGASDTQGNIILRSFSLEGPVVNFIENATVQERPVGVTDLNGITGTGAAWDVTYPQTVGNGSQFGGDIDKDVKSADISSYDYLLFAVFGASADAKTYLRVFVSTGESTNNDTRVILYPHPIEDYASVSDWTAETTITGNGIYVVKITDYPLLRGIKNKAYWQGSAGNIKIAMAYVGSGTPVAPTENVVLLGEETLSDPHATCFDVTNLEGSGLTFNATNPNALFIANAGELTNTQNVIVGGTCAKLVLTDGHPFKAPADFTATTASYTTTINAEAGAGTLCLPFAATIPGDVTAYTLSYTSGDKATATAVETTIPANYPVLLNGSGEKTFTGSGAVVAEAANTAGDMTGVFAAGAVPMGSYVLQKGSDGIGFYKVVDSDPITINPFRAYLAASGASVHNLTVDYQNGEETGIEEMRNGENEKMRSEIFDLSGRRVVKAQKGIYIVNGKKIVK